MNKVGRRWSRRPLDRGTLLELDRPDSDLPACAAVEAYHLWCNLRTGPSPWIEARPTRCRNPSLKFFRRSAMALVDRMQRDVRAVEGYVRPQAWMTMAAGSATNAWRRDLLQRSTCTCSGKVRRSACQIAGPLYGRIFLWPAMGRDCEAIGGWQTDLALRRGAWRNRYRQLQPLSIGWIGVATEAVRNVL